MVIYKDIKLFEAGSPSVLIAVLIAGNLMVILLLLLIYILF